MPLWTVHATQGAVLGCLCGRGATTVGCELDGQGLGLIARALSLTKFGCLSRVVCIKRRFPFPESNKNLSRELPYRIAFRQPAAMASSSVQNHRSPPSGLISVSS